jgi:hypothetical protein
MRLPTSLSTTMRVNLGMLLIVIGLLAVAPQTPASGRPAPSPARVCLASPKAAPPNDAVLTVDSEAILAACP